jgi:hypothetical protein
VFFALLGEALFITYFPTLDVQDLPRTSAAAPLRIPAANVPVPIPPDVTLPPPLPGAPPEANTAPQ